MTIFKLAAPEAIGQGLLCICCAAAACAAVIVLIRICFHISAELMRKLLHLSVIVALAAWLYGFADWKLAELTMAVFLVVVYLLLVLLEKQSLFSILKRLTSERSPGELRKSLCAACLMFMLLVAVCWGWLGERRLALAAILAWGPGDAAAALIGKRYGKTKLGKAKKKSLEGSLAMFTLSFLGVLIVLLWGGAFAFGKALCIAVLTAAVSTAVEFWVLNGFDTFFCPAAAMIVLCLVRLLWT